MEKIDLQKAELLVELCEIALKDEIGCAKFTYKGKQFAVMLIGGK